MNWCMSRVSRHCVRARSLAESTNYKFTPAWWLRGAHRQTLWSQFFRRERLPSLRTERVETPDGDHLFLYHLDIDSTRPRVILLHGLEGSVRSHYVAGILAKAQRRRWNATLVEFRGCGPELNAGPRMYHSGETGDLELVVQSMIEREPAAPIFLAGVSLGGNVLLKWLGECGTQAPQQVRAAVAVSVPYDLEAGCRILQRGFARVYDRHFLRSLRDKAWRKLSQHPGLFDADKLSRALTLEDFDDAVTGPVHGFSGSHDYYVKSSSIAWIDKIRVPTLLLSAEDDPFLPRRVLDQVRAIAGENRNLHLRFTRFGGHVGFLSGSIPFRPVYWAEERLMAFFDSIASGLRRSALPGIPQSTT